MDMITVTSTKTGESLELPKDLLQDLTRDYINGYQDGFSKAFWLTVGLTVVAGAVVVGTSFAVNKYLNHEKKPKTSL